jgi:predicted helicase
LFDEDEIDEADEPTEPIEPEAEKPELADFITEAYDKFIKYYDNNNRGILSLPCGLGKTYISYLTSNKKYLVGNVSLNKYTFKRRYMVLESQKQTIQEKMEARALKIILTAIIGDNNFCY